MFKSVFRRPEWAFFFLILIVILAYSIRIQHLDKDFFDVHGWKNIRHYQFAENMIKLRNPIAGICTFTQPEAGEPWVNRVTEAPWVDWTLVAMFALFKQSITVFRMTFLVVNLLTTVLLYFVLAGYLRRWLALALTLMFATFPFGVIFSTHSIGENFIYSGQILFVLTACRLFERYTLSRYIQFCAAIFYMIFCKMTTGFLLAYTGFAIVHAVLLAMHWQGFCAFLKRRPFIRIPLALGYFGVPTLTFIAFLRLGKEEWALDFKFLFGLNIYYTLLKRAEDYLGHPVMLGGLLAILGLTVMVAVARVRRKEWRIEPLEWALLCQLFCVLVNFVIQAYPLTIHEYYLNVYFIPLLFMFTVFLRRLTLQRRWWTLGLVAALTAGIWVRDVPAQIVHTRYVSGIEMIGQEDRDMLRRFFEPRRKTREKYFIITRSPYEAYAAGVNMILRWAWVNVAGTIIDTPGPRDYLKRLGIKYVVVASAHVPTDVQKSLEKSPLVDLGPGRFKLGLVERGKQFMIFKITRGIEFEKPVGVIAGPADWTQAAPDAFAVSKPFAAQGDILAYDLGKAAPGQKIECMAGDFSIFANPLPKVQETPLYVHDLQPFANRPLVLKASRFDADFAANLRLRAIKFSDPW